MTFCRGIITVYCEHHATQKIHFAFKMRSFLMLQQVVLVVTTVFEVVEAGGGTVPP
jgi:hypothetical protein